MTAVSCGGGSSGKNLNKFVGVWGAPSGTRTETCPGNPSGGGVSQVMTTVTWTLGSTSDLVQTVPGTACVFHAEVSANTATGFPANQSCTIQFTDVLGDPATALITFSTYNFVVSPDGLTATESYTYSEADTDNVTLQTGTCSITQSASYTKQ